MCPLIGLSVPNKEHSRRGGADVLQQRLVRQHIERVVRPYSRGGSKQLVDQQLSFAAWCRKRWRPTGAHINLAPVGVEDVAECSPGRQDGDAPLVCVLPVQPLEDGDVRIGAIAVRVDSRVCCAQDHLVVSRIGELEPIGDRSRALLRRVAEYLSFLRYRAPEEREQC